MLKIQFLPHLPQDYILKLIFKKKTFFGPSREVHHRAPLIFLLSIFHFFIFVFFFNVFPCFSFFPLFSLFHFFLNFPFVFLFLFLCFFLFHFVSLFSFLGCSNSVAALQDSLEKSAHSELASFALYWLVVTFPCGIVHILVMIRLRVVCSGWRGSSPTIVPESPDNCP